ncbi:MAG: NAD(P)/FAD-dependent oxidoreductase [bacterium]|nr:NAD(P)/FAD-dependent oxidoreductase [bacterium]
MADVDVLIIGAGAVGVALARELSRFELHILVVDRLNDVGGDASKSNSAIVHTGFDAPPGSLESAMVVHANPMYDELCRNLEIPFRRVGAVLVAVTEEEEAELPRIMAKARANHVYDVVPLTPNQVHELEPAVTPKVRAGLYVPRESIIDPFILVVAQAENAAVNGVTFLTNCEVVDLTHVNKRFRAATTRGEICARSVVNAAGLCTDTIGAFLGIHDFTVHPRRGQFHVLDRAAPLGIKHIILPVPTKVSKGKLLTPSVHGNWLIGPTAKKLEDKSMHTTTQEGLEEIVRDVRKLVPAVDSTSVITQYAGLRPVRTPEGYHFRTFERFPGYLELSGIRSTGITASPAVAREACHILMDMPVLSALKRHPKKTFSAVRKGIPCFRSADSTTREELIQHNSRYGHVVCRCETVTEAEIVQAIQRIPGACDLDGVKRRVRAGLGRCQGGFCGMHIPRILSRELGLSMEQVSKKGVGSELFIGHTKSLRTTR